MPVEVVLPKVDMDMESGTIAAWKVAEGSFVRQGDILKLKLTVLPSPLPGASWLASQTPLPPVPAAFAPLNQTAERAVVFMVGTPVAWIDTGDSKTKAAAVGASDTARPRSPAPASAPTSRPAAAPVDAGDPSAIALAQNVHDDGVRASPLARRAARTRGVDLRAISGSGPRGRIVEKDVDAHLAARSSGRRTMRLI